MQRGLGEDVHVIEEGLSGRTTVFEDPFEPGRSGRTHLPDVQNSHAPLDLVIIWLGTNDLFVPSGLTAQDAGRGAITLAAQWRRGSSGDPRSSASRADADPRPSADRARVGAYDGRSSR